MEAAQFESLNFPKVASARDPLVSRKASRRNIRSPVPPMKVGMAAHTGGDDEFIVGSVLDPPSSSDVDSEVSSLQSSVLGKKGRARSVQAGQPFGRMEERSGAKKKLQAARQKLTQSQSFHAPIAGKGAKPLD